MPGDLEQDPASRTYDVADSRTRRGIIVHQGYWRHYGSWRPEAWRLNFVVHHGGRLGDEGAGLTRRLAHGATLGADSTVLAGLETPLEMIKRGTFDPREGYNYAKAREIPSVTHPL